VLSYRLTAKSLPRKTTGKSTHSPANFFEQHVPSQCSGNIPVALIARATRLLDYNIHQIQAKQHSQIPRLMPGSGPVQPAPPRQEKQQLHVRARRPSQPPLVDLVAPAPVAPAQTPSTRRVL